MSNGYPFTTRNQVIGRIASEPGFVIECVRLVDERRGWMASHRPRATHLVARLAKGDPSVEDLAEAVALVTPYARTIARVLRDRQIAEGHPELFARAAVFGLVRSSPAPMVAAEAVVAPVPVVNIPATAEAPVVKKKRGRPPGAKNKPRSESEPRRRRRS